MKSLNAQLFGTFSISSDSLTYPKKGAKEASQLHLLIAYLLLAQERHVSKEELIAVLWENDKSLNPVGALRNLVYRARLELSKFLPTPDSECICFSQGEYYWNPEIPCRVDVLRFNILYEITVDPSSDATLCYKSAYQAIQLASAGQFLEGIEGNAWVNSYRETLFQKCCYCASTVCKNLYFRYDYETLCSICGRLYRQKSLPFDLCYYYMDALHQLKKFDELSEFYSALFRIAFSETDPAKREQLKAALRQARPLLRNFRDSVHAFELHLLQRPAPSSAVFLELTAFKSVLLSALRQKPLQAGRGNFLASVSLGRHDAEDHDRLMERLRSLLLRLCSPTDFVTVSGRSSYAILFTAARLQDVRLLLLKAVQELYKVSCVELSIAFQPLEQYFSY